MGRSFLDIFPLTKKYNFHDWDLTYIDFNKKEEKDADADGKVTFHTYPVYKIAAIRWKLKEWGDDTPMKCIFNMSFQANLGIRQVEGDKPSIQTYDASGAWTVITLDKFIEKYSRQTADPQVFDLYESYSFAKFTAFRGLWLVMYLTLQDKPIATACLLDLTVHTNRLPTTAEEDVHRLFDGDWVVV